jgi:hypothetical protein
MKTVAITQQISNIRLTEEIDGHQHFPAQS